MNEGVTRHPRFLCRRASTGLKPAGTPPGGPFSLQPRLCFAAPQHSAGPRCSPCASILYVRLTPSIRAAYARIGSSCVREELSSGRDFQNRPHLRLRDQRPLELAVHLL